MAHSSQINFSFRLLFFCTFVSVAAPLLIFWREQIWFVQQPSLLYPSHAWQVFGKALMVGVQDVFFFFITLLHALVASQN